LATDTLGRAVCSPWQLHKRFDLAGLPILIDVGAQELAAEQRSGQQPQPSDWDSCLDETILKFSSDY
jgi:hypothetical protein